MSERPSVAPRSSMRGGQKSSVRSSSKNAPRASGMGASKNQSRMGGSKRADPTRGGGALEHPSGVPQVIVDGFDVTPRSLLPATQGSVKTGVGGDSEREGDSQSSALMEPAFGSKSGLGSEDGLSGTKTPEIGEDTSASEAEGADEGRAAAKPKAAAPAPDAAAAPPPAQLTEADLEAQIELTMTETETFFLLDMPGSAVGMDYPDIEAVKTMNAAYDELIEKRSTMADMYVESPAQTFNLDQKPKEVQTSKVSASEMGTQASEWEIYDAYADLDGGKGFADGADGAAVESLVAAGGGGGGGAHGSAALGSASGEGSSFAASGTESSQMMDSSGAAGGVAIDGIEGEGSASPTGKAEVSLKSLGPNLPAVLRIVERMVSQNIYQSKHLQYRHIEPPGKKREATINYDESGPAATSLSVLWSFFSEEKTKERNVSCLEWNPENRDLLAAGYGEFDFAKQTSEGLICFWSLKNPESADRMIKTSCGVTAIAFSNQHPNLLAVGLYDGTVAIFDVRKQDAKPMLESGHGTGGKHTDPVWQLCWVDQGAERGEILVSISSDGRVTKWDMKKGLENQDLMKLKRVTAPNKQAGTDPKATTGGSEGIISRRASGMCIAFNIRDPNYYLAGTEDGHIHRCSCSYSEQHLESFFGHSGPVYKLRWSPFSPNIFLSCSADWTIKLWDQDNPNAIFTFSSTTDYVADICWSPNNSTVFASVTGDGRVDVWDVSVNTLDPLTYINTKLRLSTVAFSIASPVLVVGHEGGGVDVYSLEGSLAEPLGRTVQEQIDALDKVTATVQDESATVALH